MKNYDKSLVLLLSCYRVFSFQQMIVMASKFNQAMDFFLFLIATFFYITMYLAQSLFHKTKTDLFKRKKYVVIINVALSFHLFSKKQ